MGYYENGDAIRSVDTNSVLTNTFFRMFLGLLASAGTAYYVYSSGLYISVIMNGYFFPLIITAIIYLFCTFILTKLISFGERRLNRYV